jgi:putative transposase
LAILDELRAHPFYGYRKIVLAVAFMGGTRKQVMRIMKKAGLRAIYPGKRLSLPQKEHPKYPYLLRGKSIWLPNRVWASDITYIRLSGGYVNLVTVSNLFSRKVLSWRISNTLDSEYCVAALEDAIARFGVPAIFNPIKVVSLPHSRLRACSLSMGSRSVWTALTGPWIISMLSDSGDR